MSRYSILLLVCCQIFSIGCNSRATTAVSGGTPGLLVAGDQPIPEFEVKIYAVDSASPLGVAVTGNDGSFKLVQPTGDGPLWLTEGEYRITLESIGVATPRLSPAYINPSKTPLKIQWKTDDKTLDLKIPAFK